MRCRGCRSRSRSFGCGSGRCGSGRLPRRLDAGRVGRFRLVGVGYEDGELGGQYYLVGLLLCDRHGGRLRGRCCIFHGRLGLCQERLKRFPGDVGEAEL